MYISLVVITMRNNQRVSIRLHDSILEDYGAADIADVVREFKVEGDYTGYYLFFETDCVNEEIDNIFSEECVDHLLTAESAEELEEMLEAEFASFSRAFLVKDTGAYAPKMLEQTYRGDACDF